LEHDYLSGGTGGNRFATILLYMTDIGPEAGGETVFPKGWPPNLAPEDRLDSRVVSIVEISVSFGSSDKMANMQRCFRQGFGTTESIGKR
jgi:hypothetical protein